MHPHDASIDWAFDLFDGSVGSVDPTRGDVNYSLPDDLPITFDIPTSSFPTNNLTDEQLQELYGASITGLFDNGGQVNSSASNRSGGQ
jgi:hypothetical protein